MATETKGSLLAGRPRLTPCNAWSPHEAGRVKQGRGEKSVPVQCNRPSGHSGNHLCLLGSFERLAEWGQCEVVK
jgi:hypothetical protein